MGRIKQAGLLLLVTVILFGLLSCEINTNPPIVAQTVGVNFTRDFVISCNSSLGTSTSGITVTNPITKEIDITSTVRMDFVAQIRGDKTNTVTYTQVYTSGQLAACTDKNVHVEFGSLSPGNYKLYTLLSWNVNGEKIIGYYHNGNEIVSKDENGYSFAGNVVIPETVYIPIIVQ